MTILLAPNACQTMADLRAQIDAIHTDLIERLVKRSHYIDRAVDLKKIEGLRARTTDRVAEVLDKVSSKSVRTGPGSEPRTQALGRTDLRCCLPDVPSSFSGQAQR